MLIKIAWRNVWRNKMRSGIVIASIALGLWAGVFMLSFSWGMNEQRIRESIETEISHLQIHNKDFQKDKELKYFIDKHGTLARQLTAMPEVEAFSSRILTGGMAAVAGNAKGVQIIGVQPDTEDKLTGLANKVKEGKYFEGVKRNPILIGKKLGAKFKLKLRSKVVLTFQDAEGEMTAGAFKVVGFYESKNSKKDESIVYVRNQDIAKLLNIESDRFHETAVLLKNIEDLDKAVASLNAQASPNITESWKKIAPDLAMVIESFSTIMYVFMTIILLALGFGIVNTMLMSVLERYRELGMLMAVGMNKSKVFAMVVWETVFLSCLGGPIGLLTAFLSVTYLGKAGMDISGLGKEGLASYGIGTMVYPSMETHYYFEIAFMVILTALLASIYPSLKALQLNPAAAIRKI